MNWKNELRLILSNSIGWSTKRKILVFESDDWGSIRTNSKVSYDNLVNSKFNISESHSGFDCLEDNDDLELLFSLLSEFKDINNNYPIFTGYCIMANPDFEKIRLSGFLKYEFENLEVTINNYPNHDRLLKLWNSGEKDGLFSPQLHGREHLNVLRWMNLIKTQPSFMELFKNKTIGPSKNKDVSFPNYLGALMPNTREEIDSLHRIVMDAGELYFKYFAKEPSCFVAPNSEEPKVIEATLNRIGIKYITRPKIRKYPKGDNEFGYEFNWIGKRNRFNQVKLVRNAFFEPVTFGPSSSGYVGDWVIHCLNEISKAFLMNKPAIVSTHRWNYVGGINKKNRDNGHYALRKLLKEIQKKWPNVEFMSSEKLGRLIKESK